MERQDAKMKLFRKAECPYCGRKIGLLSAWLLKTQGEFQCPKCGGYSNITVDGISVLFALLAVFFSCAIFIIHLLFIKTFSIPVCCLLFLPFFLFFLSSVFLVRLRKPVAKRKPPDDVQQYRPRRTAPGERPPVRTGNEHTIVMNCVRKM